MDKTSRPSVSVEVFKVACSVMSDQVQLSMVLDPSNHIGMCW